MNYEVEDFKLQNIFIESLKIFEIFKTFLNWKIKHLKRLKIF